MARKTKEEAMETRSRLLESALVIMSEKSFSKVSMNEIAENIGFSKGAAYWHFRNKGDVLVNLVESLCADGRKELESSCAMSDSAGAVRSYFRERMSESIHSERHKRINMLFHRKMEWPEDVWGRVYSLMRGWAESERCMVERLLVKAQSDGAIRPDVSAGELSAVITAIFHGLMVFQFEGVFSVGMDLLKQTDFIFDAFTKELESPKPNNHDFQKEKVR